MADKHPYISGAGPLVQTIEQLRKSFPSAVTSETLKKLGLAPGNESFVINILRRLGLLAEDGARTQQAQTVFSKHSDEEFSGAFNELVRQAYVDLFSLHGNDAWTLSTEKLIAFFRNTDQTSALVGQRQAMTFQTLSSFAGHRSPPSTKPAGRAASGSASRKAQSSRNQALKVESAPGDQESRSRELNGHVSNRVGLTVRIEVNLPAQGDQQTYDRIFTSIRKNLLDGK